MITGLVQFVLLGPLLDRSGADHAADQLLQMAVPVLVLTWVDARATAVPAEDSGHDQRHRPERPTLRHRMRRV